MSQTSHRRKFPVGVVPRREAEIPDLLIDGPDSVHYSFELEQPGSRGTAAKVAEKARAFRHLTVIGSAATVMLSVIDWLRLDK